MKAEDLQLQEIISFGDGNIDLYGRRLIIHSMHAFAKFRKDIIDMLGAEHARRLFTRFGFFWGQADAAAMIRILKWNDKSELLKAGARLHTLQGVTPVSFDKFEYDPKTNNFYSEVTWSDSIEAEEHLTEIGWAKESICWKLVGYASGYASYCLEKPVYFMEKLCRAKGDNVCTAVGKDIDSWDEEIKPHLSFFEAEDIKGDVKKLTLELQKKMEQLSEKSRKLDSLHKKMVPYFLEFRSKELKKTFDLANRVAKFDSSILITGETGVGKEILARYIHTNSHHSDFPFMAINCAALPESLLESELFGHKAGSFTGAIRNRVGLFEQAGKGTVLLDEIGDISPAMQLKLLRVLQEKEIIPVGENIPHKINARILSATNKDLKLLVSEGTFREDLLYRLNIIELEIPSLRKRPEDILPLVRYITSKLSKKLNIAKLQLDAASIDHFMAYSWPGNVRELENVIERGAILSTDGFIRPEHLPQNIIRDSTIFVTTDGQAPQTLDQMEKKYIDFVMKSTNGNKTHAANILGVSQSTLWRKLKE